MLSQVSAVPAVVAEFLLQGQCLPAVVEGLLVLPEEGVAPADRVERGRYGPLATAVIARAAGTGPEEHEGLLNGAERGFRIALANPYPGQVVVAVRVGSHVA